MGQTVTLSRVNQEAFDEMQNDLAYPDKYKSGDVYLDKAWDVTAFILTGSVRYLKDNVLSEINNPVSHFLTYEDEYMKEFINYSVPERVKEISAALQAISEADYTILFEKRDYTARRGVMYALNYPRDDANTLRNLLLFFNDLKKFYKAAADCEEYVVTVIG